MKPTQLAELLANIKGTIVSFFSILMFVALGVGIFVGIFWMSPSLQTTADSALEQGELHHVQIQFPYGLTDEDIATLEDIEGVDEVEASRQAILPLEKDSARYTVKVQTVPERIDILTSVEGTLASQPDEIVFNEQSAQNLDIHVGDTVEFTTPKDDSGAASNKQLKSSAFRVTGIVNSAEYLSLASESYGFSTTGSGGIDAVAWVCAPAFDASAFHDGWPVVNVRSSALQGKDSFGSDYETQSSALVERIKQVGNTLADTRYHTLHANAQKQIEDGEKKLSEGQAKIDEGEKQLSKGKRTLEAGELKIKEGEAELEAAEAKLAEGEQQLAAGKEEFEQKDAEAKEELAAGKKKLDKYTALYNTAKKKLEKAMEANETLKASYSYAKKTYGSLQDSYDELASVKSEQDALLEQGSVSEKKYWKTVAKSYNKFKGTYDSTAGSISDLNDAIDGAKTEYPGSRISGKVPIPESLPELPSSLGKNDLGDLKSQTTGAMSTAKREINAMGKAKLTVGGHRYSLATGGKLVDVTAKKISAAKKELAEKKKELDAGEERYEKAKAAYEKETAKAKEQLESAEEQARAARQKVAQGKADLEEAKAREKAGKKELKEKKAELKAAKEELEKKKAELNSAKVQFGLMKDYGWSVQPRSYNGGVATVSLFSDIMKRLSFSMAALFIIVGLLVSYSAVSRIVHEQITQIGTKKALGLRSREITTSFLCYAALAVAAGAVVGITTGVFVVEGIIGNAILKRFTINALPPYIDVPFALVVTGIELVLVLGATWLACRSILRENAVELLKGEKPPAGKTRFFETWRLWDKLPLYTQTIVNNCLNDKRRVFSTIIGVAGCTALVVTAVTLNNDVLASYDMQYRNVYDFDAIVHTDDTEQDTAATAVNILQENGCSATPVVHRRASVELPSGEMGTTKLIVPQDQEKFAELYHINSTGTESVDLNGDGVWVSQAYASHMGAKVGDEVTLGGSDGAMHKLSIAGFYEFYLTGNEMVLGRAAYEKAFQTTFTPTAVLVNSNGAPHEDIVSALAAVNGVEQVIDDKSKQQKDFSDFASVSRTVVLVYLVLAVLMAIVVLLNLNVMFIEEKKRELIVLMINGFSTKAAKRYVFNDTIVLTIIGIVFGLLLGICMGSVTVGAVEPDSASFFKGIDAVAVGCGAGASIVLASCMSAIALRRVPRFNLTDINRF